MSNSIYNVNQSTHVFNVNPAPTAENPSREIWQGYLTPNRDAIDIVDERTNLLIGTIGGSAYYKFNELPKSFVAQTVLDSDIVGEVYDELSSVAYSTRPYCRLSNGNIACILSQQNSTKSGVFIYEARDIVTGDYYWVAYKVSDIDPELYEKIADLIWTPDFYSNGYDYSYISDANTNQCKFIRVVYPVNDSDVLLSVVTTLNITKVGTTYTLSASETTFNFGTTIGLYNANAPVPVAPGAATWIYRIPYPSLQNNNNAMMKGVDEGWVWFGDGTSVSTIYTYQAGYNVLTGQMSYIEPINSLATTTNFNPTGVVDVTYFFGTTGWQNPPSGVTFQVYNKQTLDFKSNNNSVTAIYSPRWENNDLVTFLNQRTPNFGEFDSTNGNLFNNAGIITTGTITFDSEYAYLSFINNTPPFDQGYTLVVSRFKLDDVIKKQEIINLPIATSQQNVGILLPYDIENGCLLGIYNGDYDIVAPFNPQFSQEYFVYWVNTSNKPNRLASNASIISNIIDNKIYSTENALTYNTYGLAIEYDAFYSLYSTLNP